MSRSVTIAQAKAHISSLLHDVEAGEEIVITRHGVAAGKLARPVPPGFRGDLTDCLLGIGHQVAAFDWRAVEDANRLPDHHKDPMDRILIATAIRTDLTVVTCDKIFTTYGLAPIW